MDDNKTLISIVNTLAIAAVVIVASVLAYYHFKPEKIRLEELKNARVKQIMYDLRYSDPADKRAILYALRHMDNMDPSEVEKIKAEINNLDMGVIP